MPITVPNYNRSTDRLQFGMLIDNSVNLLSHGRSLSLRSQAAWLARGAEGAGKHRREWQRSDERPRPCGDRSYKRARMRTTAVIVHSDPDILGGTPVFVGTRVPFRNLIDYLERNHSLDEFLDSFPTVSREQAVAALEAADEAVSARARSPR